jgi:hypothetical protein
MKRLCSSEKNGGGSIGENSEKNGMNQHHQYDVLYSTSLAKK